MSRFQRDVHIRLEPKDWGLLEVAMNSKRAVSLIAVVVVTAMRGVTSVTAEPVRSFTGARQLTFSEGNTQVCGKDRPLTLYLQNGTISDNVGCSGSVQVNGIFEGDCENAKRRLHYRGQLAGSDVLLNIESKYATAVCRWSILLHENK
jgi:hypothetical protein